MHPIRVSLRHSFCHFPFHPSVLTNASRILTTASAGCINTRDGWNAGVELRGETRSAFKGLRVVQFCSNSDADLRGDARERVCEDEEERDAAHIPVLLKEVVNYFEGRRLLNYTDCTVGAGGRAWAASLKAEEILSIWPVAEVRRLLRDTCDERGWRHVARKIVQARLAGGIHTPSDFVDVIGCSSVTRSGKNRRLKPGMHQATRSFHALRIAVNDELKSLEALPLLESDISLGESEGPVAADDDKEAVGDAHGVRTSSPTSGKQPMQVQLKVLKGKQHGLHGKLIPKSAWRVLDNLHDAGYETYLVGGSVRDLLLEQVPKDFDVLSTADPKQVKKSFPGRCFIVGRRFPICHVYSNNTIIEVSSFSTQLRNKKKEGTVKIPRMTSNEVVVRGSEGWDERDFARWENSMKRDFTINGLMYDPFRHILYDYVGGLRDLRKLKVRTVIPAEVSFTEDPARILRAIRIAARLGFSFTRSTSRAVKNQRFSLLKLNKGRWTLEANMFFAYGSAEPSLRLLWRYGVLELLLPFQAAYFVETNFRRREEGSNFLLELLRNLDKVVAPDRPCHGSLWVALLAFHLATTETKCSPVVIGAGALTVYHTTSGRKAAEKAIRIHNKLQKQSASFGEVEVVDQTPVSSECVLEEAMVLVENAKACLNRMMDASVTSQLMQELTGAEPEDSIAVAQAYSQKAYGLFKGATRDELGIVDGKQRQDAVKRENGKRSPPDAEAIARGDIEAISYLFSRIVLNTLYPREVSKS